MSTETAEAKIDVIETPFSDPAIALAVIHRATSQATHAKIGEELLAALQLRDSTGSERLANAYLAVHRARE